MNPIDYLLPNTQGPTSSSYLEQLKQEAVNDLLSFNSQNTAERLKDISTLVSNSLQPGQSTGFKELNGLIESLMVWLINTPYIYTSSNNIESLTPHFTNYLSRGSLVDTLVPYSIASLIQDGSTYTWGGFFGTLGFELYLNRTQEHYLSTSQLAHTIAVSTLKRLNQTGLSPIKNITTPLIQNLTNGDIEIDVSIYRFSTDVIQAIPNLFVSTQLVESLIRLNELIRLELVMNVEEEYLGMYHDLYIILVNDPMPNYFSGSNLYHRDFGESIIKLSNKVSEWSMKYKELLNQTKHNELITLSNNITQAFNQSGNINPIKDYETNLMALPLPGGLNELIGLASLALLNRAYIISHPSKLPDLFLQPFSASNTNYDSLVFGGSSFIDQVKAREEQEGLFSRVLSLLYLAGRLLRKSNVRDYILMGNNLSYISGWRDTDPTNITALID